PMQRASSHRALPGAIAIQPQPSGMQNIFHSDRDRAFRDDGDFASNRDGVDGARFTGKVEDARRRLRELVVGNSFAWFRRFVKGDVPIDPDAAETRINSAAL